MFTVVFALFSLFDSIASVHYFNPCGGEKSTYANPSCKGRARAGVDKYIIGTNFVSKWTIERLIEKGIYLSLNKHVCADDS